MVEAVNKRAIFNRITGAIKTAYNTIGTDFILITLVVSNLIKGSQGVGIFSITSDAVKQALATVAAVGNAYESIKATVEAVSLYNSRSKLFEHLKKADTTLSQEQRIENLTAACKHIKENSKTLHKTLKVVKSVKLGERADKILEGVATEDEKIKSEALKTGEEFVKTIRRRINTQFGFSLAHVVTRVSALAVSIVLIVTAANPVTLIFTGVVGLGILTVLVGKKIMLPSNPFDEPDKECKIQTAAFKIRQAVYRISDRMAAFFNRPCAMQPSPS